MFTTDLGIIVVSLTVLFCASYFISIKVQLYRYYKKYRMRVKLFKNMRLPAAYYEAALLLALKIWLGSALVAGTAYFIFYFSY